MQIKHRFISAVLWEGECENIREELTAALKSGANLRGADLRSADLRGADLRGANLRGANLREADLREANLREADLREADLREANLIGADLRGADLRSAKGISPALCTPLLMLHDQPGPIRAYKLVNAASVGPFNGGITYEVGGCYEVPNACTDVSEQCAAGISLATLDWCLREWCKGYRVLVAEFYATDIAAIPTATDGKFRVHRCRIVAEKDLTGFIRGAATPEPGTGGEDDEAQ
jgi:hypothetical protein